MTDPRQFTCFDDFDNNGFGKPLPDEPDNYVEPSEPEIMEDDMEDTDV